MDIIKKVFSHIFFKISFFYRVSLKQFIYKLFLPDLILSGPFKGMNYIRFSTGSVILPKIIGTYEDELHSIFESIKTKSYNLFVDVGAAEGYYAVGVSKFIFNEKVPVVAFEITSKGRKLIKALSKINTLTNIRVEGICTISNLKETLSKKRTFIIMDVEGAEYDLLNTKEIDFSLSDILVEIHPNSRQGLQDEIISRFKQSHNIDIIIPQSKKFPQGLMIPSWMISKKNYLINEFRGPQSWLWIESKVNI